MQNKKLLFSIGIGIFVIGLFICFTVAIFSSFNARDGQNGEVIEKHENIELKGVVIDSLTKKTYKINYHEHFYSLLGDDNRVALAIIGNYYFVFGQEVIFFDDLGGYGFYNGELVLFSDEFLKILKQNINVGKDNGLDDGDCCSCCPDLKPGESCIALCCPCGS